MAERKAFGHRSLPVATRPQCLSLPSMISIRFRSLYRRMSYFTVLRFRPGMQTRNRAENSHLPFRKRERAMHGFRSPVGLQRFVAAHSAARNRFTIPARRRSALTIHYHRLEAFDI